jgi:hypothetical protein
MTNEKLQMENEKWIDPSEPQQNSLRKLYPHSGPRG